MTFFYLGALALIISAVVFALWPLIRGHFSSDKSNSELVQRQNVNIALYQDHLADLDASLSSGAIDQSQFTELKLELERNLLEDSADFTEGDQSSPSSVNKTLYLGLVLLILPLTTWILYQQLGSVSSWQLKEQLAYQSELEQRLFSGDNTIESELTRVNEDLVKQLQHHVKKRPDDLDSRVLLARNAATMGRYELAIEAYQQVLEREPNAGQVMAELAQAVFLQANNQAVPIVGMLAERALSIQPNNPMALGLMGIFSFQSEDYKKAIDYWQRAIAVYPPNSPNVRALENGLAQARSRLNDDADGNVSEANDVTEESDRNAKIKVAVSLSESVPAKPSHTVFVYARAWQGARVPLAITRIQASELPITIELNDSMAMAPGMNLSSAEQVEVIARLSPSGNAITQPDDWQVSLGPIQPQSASASVYPLVISQPVNP